MTTHIECMKSELDLFEPHPTQSSILRTEEVSYNPIASLDSASSIEFVCLGNGETYRDLSSVYLRLVVQLRKNDNGSIEGDNVGVVNNILHSMFRSSSYLQTILNYGSDATESHLTTQGYYPNYGKLLSGRYVNTDGSVLLKKIFQNSNKVELFGKVNGDIFNQPKLLINNVDLRITFNIEKTAFYLMESETESNLKILEAQLFMNHITINPSILLAHHHVLQTKNAIYPYSKAQVKSFTIYPGNNTLSIDNAVIGQIPNFLAFCMVKNKSYSGNRTLNPFNFEHFKIQRFNLLVNGVQVPSQALEFDFSNSENAQSSRGYNMLFRASGIRHYDRGLQITKEMYDKNSFILAFDLTADHYNSTHCSNLISQGAIRIEGRFSEPLTEAVTCLVYCEYDSMIDIDKHRNIRVLL
ncbi:uncharacterized protein LOC121405409 [Drosophila obscura]|uniref:uncharacterized protein LOC111081515 n=1 Tax=Drosophila obscura TaxID=7282 RepID=UPI001BB1F758|nr:uncharacterized protein LOC111081515 [Drosophila obscura]XP_041450134.1 uncharacterized protein LOC121404547 [Drosophila obscura]XP_041451626.1 uncharacterized protein LOC121405095 [Drosophila obscura]XP_041451765.1 uncharacterized protein LOC121405222 [Drosophila obscura]XP_041452017.1 uncharacterized protein LOC121405409 [Drosophila obscura]